MVEFIDDYEKLKIAVDKYLHQYIDDKGMKNVEIDPDIRKEYDNQKKYLVNSVNSLKKRLDKEIIIHKEDKMNIMRENIKLISQITYLRKNVKELDSQLKNQNSKMNKINQEQ